MECSGRPVEVTDPKTDPEKDKRDANVTICHYSFSSLSSAEASDESKITNVPLNLLEMVSSAEFQNRYKAKPSSLSDVALPLREDSAQDASCEAR